MKKIPGFQKVIIIVILQFIDMLIACKGNEGVAVPKYKKIKS